MKIDALWLRANVIKAVRNFFWERGFLEVETPLLIPANAPEEHINPVTALPSWQLQTSPEICMKRLLCKGHKRLFQISRCWRADERGSRHLSEFTMLEWYRAGADYLELMEETEALITAAAAADCISYCGHSVQLAAPWERLTVAVPTVPTPPLL